MHRAAVARLPAQPARSTRTCRSATCRSPATSPTRSTREWIALDDELDRDREHLRRVRGADRVRRALADPVPRDQPRLAGERSRAGRDHDRVRRADRRGADRRLRRVRRRDARRRSREPRIEGTFKGERMRAWDVVWGTRRADVVIENSYVDVSNAVDDRRRLGDPRRRPVLARLPAQGRRRGDRRARPARRAGRWRICATPSSSTTIRSRACVSGEFHLYGKYQTPFGFGRLIDRRRASPTASRSTRATASLRFEGTGVRLDKHRHHEEHRQRHRRGVGRLGRQLLVQRRRRADPGRVADDAPRFPRAPLSGLLAVQRHRRRHVRRAALRRRSCASTTCSPATKASASSSAGCRCAASC